MAILVKKVTTTIEEYLQDSGEVVPPFESAPTSVDAVSSVDAPRSENLERASAAGASTGAIPSEKESEAEDVGNGCDCPSPPPPRRMRGRW